MLPRRELNVGRSYVNEKDWMALEVVELGRTIVKYKTYDLTTGKLCGASRACTKKAFIKWADREATSEETAYLQLHEADALYKNPEPVIRQDPDLSAEQIMLMTRNEMNNRY
jgi:hypothetical protein